MKIKTIAMVFSLLAQNKTIYICYFRKSFRFWNFFLNRITIETTIKPNINGRYFQILDHFSTAMGYGIY